ncbi:site-2 protease family protein [Carbonactinospora thermoautotrophica]|uniref:site-2 protease family protein n=1 Tax=Carbonactinospora thermoautotrophica TaxID=1469144 RepID=UPI0022706D34|nr:site-2 protease family protein [Carbonactinospora thermoautotrophica]
MSDSQRDPGHGNSQGDDGQRNAGTGLLIGRPFGIPVYVSPSWFIVAALITVAFEPAVREQLGSGAPFSYLVAFTFAVLLYASVLVHELSHSVVARCLGLPVRRISLYLLGGVSEIEREPRTPGQEFLVAFAGPLLSLVLGGCGILALQVVEGPGVGYLLLFELTFANLLVGGFNLVPGLPLDGGRVLRAAVWKLTGRSFTGTVVAAWVGRAAALVIIALPALAALAGRSPGLITLAWALLIGSFIWMGAAQAVRHARIRERLPLLRARTLTRRALPVSADLPLSEALRRAGEVGANAFVVVDHEDKPVAVVSGAAVAAVPPQRRPWVQVGHLARTLEPGMIISAELSGERLIAALRAVPATEYLVVEPTGEVFGVLAAADVERAFVKS